VTDFVFKHHDHRARAERTLAHGGNVRTTVTRQFKAQLHRHGITDDLDILTLYFAAHAGCEICGRSNPDGLLCVDHDHATNQYRGLLCHRCNRAIGALEDDHELLLRAAAYLGRA
jgi:hypothetical protein